MERTGFSAVVKEGYDIYGNFTLFRVIAGKLVKECVNNDKWFGFARLVSENQVDLMKRTIEDGDFGLSIESCETTLAEAPKEAFNESAYRISVFKYMLHEFLCYFEEPAVRRNSELGVVNSYNKALVTSNLGVVAAWLGISYEEAKRQYGYRLAGADLPDEGEPLFPYVKLYATKEGVHKVTKPRTDLDLGKQGVRVQPLFALKVGVSLLYKKASSEFYDVTFVKDSGQVRTVNVCFSLDKLREVYDDEGKLMIEFQKQYSNNFIETGSLERGYIRVIEVGRNLDCGATRSINFARITDLRPASPDTTFIHTNLDTVCQSFINCVSFNNVPINELVDVLEALNVGSTRKYAGREIKTFTDLDNWVQAQQMLLSTPFVKQLALCMMGNPQWFKGWNETTDCYTNNATDTSSNANISIEEVGSLDSLLEIDLD